MIAPQKTAADGRALGTANVNVPPGATAEKRLYQGRRGVDYLPVPPLESAIH